MPDTRKFAPDPTSILLRTALAEYLQGILGEPANVSRHQFMSERPEEDERTRQYGSIRAPRYMDRPQDVTPVGGMTGQAFQSNLSALARDRGFRQITREGFSALRRAFERGALSNRAINRLDYIGPYKSEIDFLKAELEDVAGEVRPINIPPSRAMLLANMRHKLGILQRPGSVAEDLEILINPRSKSITVPLHEFGHVEDLTDPFFKESLLIDKIMRQLGPEKAQEEVLKVFSSALPYTETWGNIGYYMGNPNEAAAQIRALRILQESGRGAFLKESIGSKSPFYELLKQRR